MFLVLVYTSCSSDSLPAVNAETTVENQLEDLPIVDFDYDILVKFGMLAFETEEQFDEAYESFHRVQNQESILKWTKSLTVNTLYGELEGISDRNSFNGTSELASIFKEIDPISGEVGPSQEVLGMAYFFQNAEGFLIIGDKIGFFSSSLQVWAPLDERISLRTAIMEGNKNSLEAFDVIYDHRTDSWMSSLVGRGSDFVDAPVCPWIAGSGTQWSDEHINVNNESTRRCKSQWRHEQMVTGSYPNRTVKQSLTCWVFSYKKTFGYKTDHYFRWNIRYSTNRPGNPVSSVTGSGQSRGKRFGRVFTYHQRIGIQNSTELAQYSTQILDFPSQGTKHSHRGMGGEWNILQCP